MTPKERTYLVAFATSITIGVFFSTNFFIEASCQSKGVNAATKVGEGLNTTTFETPKGKINVNLPEDMEAGDELTGTVVAEPAGKSEQEKEEAGDELSGYVVEIKNAKQPEPEVVQQPPENPQVPVVDPGEEEEEKPKSKKEPPKVTKNPPSAPGCTKKSGGGALSPIPLVCWFPPSIDDVVITLKDPTGKQVCTQKIVCPGSGTHPPAKSGSCDMPEVGQCGRPVTIKTTCDGKFSNSGVTVGDKPCDMLAESPRTMVAKVPKTVTGKSKINIKEGKKTFEAPFCALKIALSADKTVLQKGESAHVTVKVTGTEGLTQPVKLKIYNKTPDTVQMPGGAMQEVTVYPTGGGGQAGGLEQEGEMERVP
ncbi:MAG: hypothetical protein K2Z81_01975 [Cyanobacteria bacterium]|nr:hypothetical protein [Cyanobacteriota bacterium]